MKAYRAHLDRIALFHPVRRRLAAGVGMMALATALQLAYPQIAAGLIDHVETIRREGPPAHLGLLLVGAGLLYSVASALRIYLFESSGFTVVMQLRRRLFSILINQPIAFFDHHHVGELSSRLNADVQTLNDTVTTNAAYALSSLLTLAGSIAMLLSISPLLSLLLILLLPVNLALGRYVGKGFRQCARRTQSALADSARLTQEYFSHIRLVHSLNQQAGVATSYGQACRQIMATARSVAYLSSFFHASLAITAFLGLLLPIWLGSHLIAQGVMTVGELTAFILYSGMAGGAASTLTDFWNGWMRMIGATDRIFELLLAEQPASTGTLTPALSGALRFRELSFCYPARPAVRALHKATFQIAAGEKIALVGPSGAGKSTIASLVLRHYHPNSGTILFDDLDACTLDVAWVRSQIAIVEQEPSLFSGSLRENLAFAVPDRELSLEEIVAAARLANAHDFISNFPDGYETLVGERGVQLSGGQKQRIAIARAMLRNPKILILDEATSALDAASEHLVQGALDRLMEGRTTLIIAHRFSTIVKADRILVMEAGVIRQHGRHETLLADREGLYYRLMRHQISQFEVLSDNCVATE